MVIEIKTVTRLPTSSMFPRAEAALTAYARCPLTGGKADVEPQGRGFRF
jgi:hypothetical protein